MSPRRARRSWIRSASVDGSIVARVGRRRAHSARQLAEPAHANCPYSKAVRGDIRVTVDVADD